MTRDDTLEARDRKRLQNRAAQKSYRERMKRKMEDLEKWRDVALAMTPTDSSGHLISDSSDTSINKSQPSVSMDSLDSEPYTAAVPPEQLYLPISKPHVVQYEPISSVSHANFQPSVASGMDDIFSLDWNTSMDPSTIARLPSHPKKLAREAYSPNHALIHATRQRSKSIISGDDFDNESSHRDINKPWGQRRTADDLGDTTASSCGTENKGKTAFHLAAQRGQRNLVALLLPAVNDLNSRDSLGRTALHLAAEGGHSDIVVMLLEKRRQSNRHEDQVADINAQDSEGRSAVHLAIKGNFCSAIAVLVQNPNIDIELKDHAGLTPLHQSILAGHEEIVKLLVANGADLNVKIG